VHVLNKCILCTRYRMQSVNASEEAVDGQATSAQGWARHLLASLLQDSNSDRTSEIRLNP